MQTELLNSGLALLEGFGLIVSPCILPILPIILSGSLEGSKKRPIGIIVGFVLMFAIFTFFSRQLVHYTGIDLGLIRHISYGLLLVFGVVMLSTTLTEKFTLFTSRLANTGTALTSINNPQGGFISGILFGALVGIIWTPCAGPILAAVIVQTVLQKTTFSSFLTVLFFGIGAAIPMLLIALFGRSVMTRIGFFKTHAMLIRKLLGGIIIIAVAYMIYSESFPESFARTGSSAGSKQTMVVDGVITSYPMPEIAGITEWINSSPITTSSLKGKVVLIDFWTYSCINCIRTLPYLLDWYNKYHDKGLVIIGIHSPEFDFEKNFENVKNAVIKNNIHYPVALDNQFTTWQHFNNRYWPAHYLIDKSGYVVYQHFGEGHYDVTENNIRFLLGLNASNLPASAYRRPFNEMQTPETYLGSERAENFASPEKVVSNKVVNFTFPEELSDDQWAMQGAWIVSPKFITSAATNAMLKIHFNAGKVYVVMGNTTQKPIKVKLRLNGELVVKEKGRDVMNSVITVNRHALYEAVVLPRSGNGILELTASAPGLEVYTFTFGG